METSGVGQTGETDATALIVRQMRKLLELQGELVVNLIDSAKVPGPQDTSKAHGLGGRVDFHV